MQGVKVVIAQSFERIHRSNLVGMGILPGEFTDERTAESIGLTGKEEYDIPLKGGDLKIGEILLVRTNTGKEFEIKVRLDTDVEIEYFKHGGILQYVLRKLIKEEN
jgi:aconitate hydratase